MSSSSAGLRVAYAGAGGMRVAFARAASTRAAGRRAASQAGLPTSAASTRAASKAARALSTQRGGVQRLLAAIRRTPWWHYDATPHDAVAAKADPSGAFRGEVARNRALFEELMAQGNAHNEALRAYDAAPLAGAPVDGTEVVAPRAGAADATLMFVHGGGFVVGSPGAYRGAVASLLARAPGVRAVVPRYALAPERELPAAVADVAATYEWLAARGPVAVAADSAGCYLALRALERSAMPPAGVLCWSPFLRHHPRLDGPRRPLDDDDSDFLDAHAIDVVGAAAHPEDDRAHDEAHARALAGPPSSTPLKIVAGAAELLRGDAEALAAAAPHASLDVVDEMFHDFMLFPRFVREGEEALDESGAFVAACLAAT